MERTRPPRAVEIMLRYFGSLEDPRIDRTKFHPLENIILMALCGAIGGCASSKFIRTDDVVPPGLFDV
jgi:hypothetical protein